MPDIHKSASITNMSALDKFSDLPYFTREEVLLRNKPHCCCVIIFDLVRNITMLIREYKGQPEIKPLLSNAGKDISHWFDEATGDIKHHIHPETGVRVPFTPFGAIPHVDTHLPSYRWKGLKLVPWWKDDKYIVGKLTKNTITVGIINVLTNTFDLLTVCCEDTLKKIEERYSKFNSNTSQYVWRNMASGKDLNMDKTLEENGIFTDGIYEECTHRNHIGLYFKDEIY